MPSHYTIAATLFASVGLCSSVLPKTNAVQNTNLFLYIREPSYPRNYDSDPVGLCPVGSNNAGQALCPLSIYNTSFPTFTFVPDKTNKAKNGANSGKLIYDAENNGVQSLNQHPVSTSGSGAEFEPGGSNPQNLFVQSGSTPVPFYYNFQSEEFGVLTKNGSKTLQQTAFFVCQAIYQGQEAVQVPGLVFTPLGAYPGPGCENVTLIAST